MGVCVGGGGWGVGGKGMVVGCSRWFFLHAINQPMGDCRDLQVPGD